MKLATRLMQSISVVTTILVALYPIIVYLGFLFWESSILWGMLLILGLRFFIATPKIPQLKMAIKLASLLGCLLITSSILFKGFDLALYYPVAMNCVFLFIFGLSLVQKQTIIEIFARLTTPNLEPFAIKYCRVVTIIWCFFFIINGSIALCTCLFDPTLGYWVLYNGLISYVLIGLLVAGEFIVRKIIQRKLDAKI